MGNNKILDYTSIGEKKGKFDALANSIKESLSNVSSGLGELEKGTISQEQVDSFQSEIQLRVNELDEISEKFKNYLSYIIESNQDEDSKQAAEVAEEVGLMKTNTSQNQNGGGSGSTPSGGGSSGGSNGGGSNASASSNASATAPSTTQPQQQGENQNQQQAPENVAKTDYEAYKKETSERFQKTIDDQKKVDEKQNKVINNLSTDFNKYKNYMYMWG